MKKVCFLVLSAVMLLNAQVLIAQAWLTNSLVGYYPFTGNANDQSGNGKNGTVNGAILTSNRFGISATAYLFNGGQSIFTPLLGPDGTKPRTISGWFRTGSQNRQAIVTYGSDGSGSRIEVGINSGSIYLDVFAGTQTWPGNFANSAWHQFILVYETNSTMQNIKVFIDGNLVSNSTGDAPTRTISTGSDYSVQIGQLFYQGDQRYFSGQLDDVRIYARALSSNEASQLYAIEAELFCSPHAATATAQVVNGFLVGATLTDTGCGYTNAPLVLVQGNGSGSNAVAQALLGNDGKLTGITILNPGSSYSTNPLPRIIIASPPFVPTVSISVSRVNVSQHVVLGRKYSLESSLDLVNWAPVGPDFVAQSEEINTEFLVNTTGQSFRIREVP